MSSDDAPLDPDDPAALEDLYREITEFLARDVDLTFTDDVGLTDSLDVTVTPAAVGAKAGIPQPTVVVAEAHITRTRTLEVTGHADTGIDPAVVAEATSRARRLARRLLDTTSDEALRTIISLLIVESSKLIMDSQRDHLVEVWTFVGLVLSYLHR